MITLNIQAAQVQHDDVRIIGSPEALQQLKGVIEKAICTGTANMDAFASDGEGYTFRVQCLPDNDLGNTESEWYKPENRHTYVSLEGLR